MRWAGLRISDATTLNHTQLIERASGNGWAIKVQQTQKTKEAVYIPIPSFVEAALRELPYQCEQEGRRYWFWSGAASIEGTKNNWYTKIMRVVERLSFLHEVTPHSFRHTFAISHLNAGVDIKQVSRWLSHASVTVTERHYAHAIHGTLVASDEAFDRSLKQQLRVMTA
jgi:integrase